MAITTLSGKGSSLTHQEVDANWTELDRRTRAGWKDNVSPLSIEGLVSSPAVYKPFGPSGNRAELAFAVGQRAYVKPFHVNHDILVNGRALLHTHWSTNGSDTAVVKWEFEVTRALGHQQAYFGGEVTLSVEQAGWAGPWRHMVAEVDLSDALILTEPDELLLVTLRRVSNGAVDNANEVFGLVVDMHYEADRDSTPNRMPDFYGA